MKEQNEKQAIEEIAKVIANFMYKDCGEVPFNDIREIYESICKADVISCSCCKIARGLTKAGYRKQSEGEWIAHEDEWCGTFYTCSACKCDWTTIDGTPQENNMRFCPECGAKMKGGAE